MIEQDYIMRIITTLAAFLARVLLLKQKKDFPRALLEIQTTGRTLLGIDRTMIRQLRPEEIARLLGVDPTLSAPKCYVLGVLLSEESEIRRLQGEADEAAWLDTTALSLLIDAYQKAGEGLEAKHVTLIDTLCHRIPPELLGREQLDKVFRFYEQIAQFGKAENVLYELLRIDDGYHAEAIRFYERLLSKPDKDLEAGGLPRDELVEALNSLRKES
ncbi:MAG TPA: DUF6483 family protein [Bacteroidota bacterium]|nr:DUF6483 family protein [Bacteroidota bacterium]